LPAKQGGNEPAVEEKRDYSPVAERAPEPERHRERRGLAPAMAFSWGFLGFALLVAFAIVLVVYFIT
jgi:hypothetical protein